MFKNVAFVLTFVVLTSLNLYAQESCSCSSTTCSASQSCGAGKSAVCVCSATGCSSSCNGGGEVIPENNISGDLSSAYGLNVKFEPTNKNYKFSASRISQAPSWDLLDELSRNGDLTINGQNLGFWKGLNKTLIDGGEFRICSGGASVQRVLGIISFVSGKKYTVTSGNAEAVIKGRVEGNNLTEVLNSLQKIGEVTVAEIE